MFFLEEAAAAVVRGQAALPVAGGVTESGSVPGGWCCDSRSHRFTSLLLDSPRLPCADGAVPRPATSCRAAAVAKRGVHQSRCEAALPFSTGPFPTGRALGCGYPTSSQRSILRTAHSMKDAEITSGSFIITHLPPARHLFQSLQRVMKEILP